MSRQNVTTTINKYVKDNNLQNPENRRYILLESDAGLKLKALLRDPDQPLTFFNIQRYLKPHYPAKIEKETKNSIVVDTPPAVVADAAVVDEEKKEAAPKKKIVRRVVAKA